MIKLCIAFLTLEHHCGKRIGDVCLTSVAPKNRVTPGPGDSVEEQWKNNGWPRRKKVPLTESLIWIYANFYQRDSLTSRKCNSNVTGHVICAILCKHDRTRSYSTHTCQFLHVLFVAEGSLTSGTRLLCWNVLQHKYHFRSINKLINNFSNRTGLKNQML